MAKRRRSMFGRGVRIGVLACILAGLLVWGVLYYAKPQEQLAWSAEPPRLADKLLEMAIAQTTELTLTEQDVNGLLQAYLRSNPQIAPDVSVEGARFELVGDLLTAHVRLSLRELASIGAAAEYRLTWQAPYLIAHPERLYIRQLPLPVSMLEVLRVPLVEELPAIVDIRGMVFDGNELRIRFAANLPSVDELRTALAGVLEGRVDEQLLEQLGGLDAEQLRALEQLNDIEGLEGLESLEELEGLQDLSRDEQRLLEALSAEELHVLQGMSDEELQALQEQLKAR